MSELEDTGAQTDAAGSDSDSDSDAGSTAIESLESLLHDVPLRLSVELGRVSMNLRDLAARLGPGSVIPLDKTTGDKLDVRINDRLVARAEAVAIGERCGIRVLEIVDAGEADRS